MELLIVQKTSAVRTVAREVSAHTKRNPAGVIGFATGGTMEEVYQLLTDDFRAGRLSFGAATSFNLDEYVGLHPPHPASYRSTMKRLLFDHVDFNPQKAHLPNGAAPSPHDEANRYEALIEASGGIDLQLLGIGQNGHIGFNEPGSPFGARTRVVDLAATTLEANQACFPAGQHVPRRAITMGTATILAAKRIVLLALGPQKAEAVSAMISGPISPYCPASALRAHPNVLVVIDHEAASLVRPAQNAAAVQVFSAASSPSSLTK